MPSAYNTNPEENPKRRLIVQTSKPKNEQNLNSSNDFEHKDNPYQILTEKVTTRL